VALSWFSIGKWLDTDGDGKFDTHETGAESTKAPPPPSDLRRALMTRTMRRLRGHAGDDHYDLTASDVIGPVPMLVDWEYAQLADPVYDLACLSIYYPGRQRRGGELLDAAGITDANANLLRLHVELFDSLNRQWEQAQALRHACGP
jgi:hypothetical protein